MQLLYEQLAQKLRSRIEARRELHRQVCQSVKAAKRAEKDLAEVRKAVKDETKLIDGLIEGQPLNIAELQSDLDRRS